jgi:hypothetical protein
MQYNTTSYSEFYGDMEYVDKIYKDCSAVATSKKIL